MIDNPAYVKKSSEEKNEEEKQKIKTNILYYFYNIYGLNKIQSFFLLSFKKIPTIYLRTSFIFVLYV